LPSASLEPEEEKKVPMGSGKGFFSSISGKNKNGSTTKKLNESSCSSAMS